MDDRVDGPIRPMKREPSQEWITGANLRPGGSVSRAQAMEPNVSLRPGGPAAAGAGAGVRSSSASSLRSCISLLNASMTSCENKSVKRQVIRLCMTLADVTSF